MEWTQLGPFRAIHWPAATTSATRPLVIIHGMFGSPENWASWGTLWSAGGPVWAVQLPCHGSGGTCEDLAYPALADALAEALVGVSGNSAAWTVLGHSLGGKAAMALALRHPGLVGKCVVVDSAPRDYGPKHAEVFSALEAVDLGAMVNRSDADAAMVPWLPNQAERAFFQKSLKKQGESWSWGFDLASIKQAYAGIVGWDHGLQDGKARWDGPVLFVRGERSDYILDTDEPAIKALFPAAAIRTVAGAGHWVQAENRQGFMDAVADFV